MKLLSIMFLLLSSSLAFSAESNVLTRELASIPTPEVKIGSIMDFYYLYSPERRQEGTTIQSRNYDRRNNDFTMNLFELNIEATMGDVSFYADLDFGDFADQNQAHDDDGVNHNIGQAFLTYNFSEQFSLTAGKMYTHVGYEVAKAVENWNYSRSFAFSRGGPFWHEGIALRYNHGSGFNGGLFVYDSADTSTESNSEKTYGTQLGYATEKFNFLFNFISGPETRRNSRKRTVYEFNTQYALSDSISVALNGVFGSEEEALATATDERVDAKWNSWVVYLNWQASKKWSFTPRVEVFSDQSDDDANSDQFIFSDVVDGTNFGATEAVDITSYTMTASYQTNEYSQFRFEYRTDRADEDVWTDEDGELQDELTTLSLSWLVKI